MDGPQGLPTGYLSGLIQEIEWGFGGQLSVDQNSYIGIHRAPRDERFAKFEALVDVAPVGGPIYVDWLVDGVTVPAMRITIPAGSFYGYVIYSLLLPATHTLRPAVNGVGATTPGSTISMAARYST